ncbi:MAG: hypothetical protein RR325_01960 [Bacilli bacterium]
MQSIIKYKRFIFLGLGFILLPLIVPIFSSTIDVIFNLGVVLGTEIRHILTGFMC